MPELLLGVVITSALKWKLSNSGGLVLVVAHVEQMAARPGGHNLAVFDFPLLGLLVGFQPLSVWPSNRLIQPSPSSSARTELTETANSASATTTPSEHSFFMVELHTDE